MIKEYWRPVVGFERWYQVSDLGNARRIKTNRGEVIMRPLKLSFDKNGYPFVCLVGGGKTAIRRIHSMVAEAFLGPRPDGLHVDHLNGQKDDARLVNLQYVTASENARRYFGDLLTAGPMSFYGVDNNTFRVKTGGRLLTFEAKEDEDDGYRSMLAEVALVANDGVFSRLPICRVTVKEAPARLGEESYGTFDGYQLVDSRGHVWLTLGTDNSDDYYPSFVFNYTPPAPEVTP